MLVHDGGHPCRPEPAQPGPAQPSLHHLICPFPAQILSSPSISLLLSGSCVLPVCAGNCLLLFCYPFVRYCWILLESAREGRGGSAQLHTIAKMNTDAADAAFVPWQERVNAD